MAVALAVLTWVSTGLFAALGLVSLATWVRHRGRQQRYVAMALGFLGLVAVAGNVSKLTWVKAFLQGDRPLAVSLGGLEIALFVLSGYALILLRDSVLPMSRRSRWTFRWAVLLAMVGGFAAELPLTSPEVTDPSNPPLTAGVVAAIAIVLYAVAVWCVCVGEPAFRFWVEARSRRAVQRARLRALAGGYGLIVIILVIDLAGFKAATNPFFQIGTQLIVLLAIPALYASLVPPYWLRRMWRAKEEEQYLHALRDLMAHSTDPRELAKSSIEWAVRLTGAEAAAIIDADGTLLCFTLPEAHAQGPAVAPARPMVASGTVSRHPSTVAEPERRQ